MQKIGDITNTADGNGEYTNGNVGAGVAPTLLDAEWFNAVQREIINVLSKAGIQPNKNNDAQLSEAIGQLISSSKITLTDNLGDSSGLAASQTLTNQVNDNANGRLEKSKNGADIPDPKRFVDNLGLTKTVERANNALDKNSGGELLAPVKFSGFRTNTGSIVISTQSDGNGVGDGQTQFGYNVGSDSAPVFNHYLRGQGITNIDTSGGCDIREGLRVGKQVQPGDFGNFDSRYLKLSQNGSDIPNKSAFRTALELGDAALRTVGNEYTNIPSMGYFLASLGYNGWQQIPSQDGSGDLIIQWGGFGGYKYGEGATVKFLRPFPHRCVFVVPVAIVPWETKTTTIEPVYLAEKSATYATFRKGGTETLDGLYIALGY